jgi:hypothetical protein
MGSYLKAVDFMIQDIRLAGLNPLGSPGIGIQAASPSAPVIAIDSLFKGLRVLVQGFKLDDGRVVAARMQVQQP